MGAMIAADPWLFTLSMRGLKQHKVAGTILRASILTGHRTGHVLDLGTDQVRRAVTHAAAWGHVSKTPVRCQRCGCIAGLTEWVRVATKSRKEILDCQDAAGGIRLGWSVEARRGSPLLRLRLVIQNRGEKPVAVGALYFEFHPIQVLFALTFIRIL